MSDSLISQELIETVFISLQEEDRNIQKIIKGVFDFLKENNYSNNEIRIALQEFFAIRREYIISEYNITYNQVGFIVENLIANIPFQSLITPNTSNVNVSTDSNVNVSTDSSNNQDSKTDDDSSDEDEEHFPRTRYVRSNYGYRSYNSYDPFMGLYTFASTTRGNNRFASLFNQGTYYINSNGVQISNPVSTHVEGQQSNQPSTQQTVQPSTQQTVQQVNYQGLFQNAGQPLEYPATINLNYSSTTQLLNSLSNIFAAANEQYVNVDEDDDEEELEAIPSINNNAALNLFNMILNSPALTQLRAPNMEDVKNVINKEELDNLEVKDWSILDKEKYKTCPICLDDYSEESKVRILKCEHGFHPECVDNWLTKCNYKCPVCRDDSNKHHAEI